MGLITTPSHNIETRTFLSTLKDAPLNEKSDRAFRGGFPQPKIVPS
ncbi:MAG: hypothetical protein H6925_02220 [Holosporaceae bacterium]|nr:MAG: hypothetical protein H6925_02220 [Holosporaceae bacterium]